MALQDVKETMRISHGSYGGFMVENFKKLLSNWIEREKLGKERPAVVMMDEMKVTSLCLPSEQNVLKFDLSFLKEFTNIQFVISLSPNHSRLDHERYGIKHYLELPLFFELEYPHESTPVEIGSEMQKYSGKI